MLDLVHHTVGMNIKICFYRCQAGVGRVTRSGGRARFSGNIEAIELNSEYAAVLCEGRIHLQLIEPTKAIWDQHAEIFSENEGRNTYENDRDSLDI